MISSVFFFVFVCFAGWLNELQDNFTDLIRLIFGFAAYKTLFVNNNDKRLVKFYTIKSKDIHCTNVLNQESYINLRV